MSDQPGSASVSPTLPIRLPYRRVRIGLSLTIFGFVTFVIGARPALFGLDRSPVIGFIQIAVLLVGLAFMCLGGYLSLLAMWKGQPVSIPADIGLRLVATGYVVAVFAGMADIFGFGSHPFPIVPYFGPYQALGVMIGEMLIAIGFVMMVPYGHLREHPSRAA